MSDPTLLVLASVADGDKHGYAMMEDIQHFAGVRLGPGTLYGAITRLEQRGWISSEWGASDNNRRAKFYKLTKAGRKQIGRETHAWERTVALMERFLRGAEAE